MQEVQVLLDLGKDESYTPYQAVVQAGSHPSRLFDLTSHTFDMANGSSGWHHIATTWPARGRPEPVEAFVLRLLVLSNHQGGRDTRIRGLRIIAQKQYHGHGLGF
jgi:anaphase-promoting complex subunit 10